MRVLMINKFLYPNGGSETYIFKLGEYLIKQGHEVEYFGMEHDGNCVGNRLNLYTTDTDFHTSNVFKKLTYAAKTIYSVEARKKLRKVLNAFKPDICHLNNFNYQLTPSIILEIKQWEKDTKHKCKIIYTAHDYQLICPNHMCNIPSSHINCEKCLPNINGKPKEKVKLDFSPCVTNKCIHNSKLKSIIGAMEATCWNTLEVYKNIDKIICCSQFLKTKLDTNPTLKPNTVVLHNFTTKEVKKQRNLDSVSLSKQNYVLYFGRYSEEKGVETLLEVCKELPDIQFIFAGKPANGEEGLLEKIHAIPNIKEVGFLTGENLDKTISEAIFTIYPSEWYENCPFSIIESQMLGTPVVASNIGGIPELIDNESTGLLFEAGNKELLKNTIAMLYADNHKLVEMQANCLTKTFMDMETYYKELMLIYKNN